MEDPNLIFFTIPRKFEGKDKIVQENCLNSIKLIDQFDKLILASNEKEIDEYCFKNDYEFLDISLNVNNKPLVSEAFYKISKKYPESIIVFCNSDIIIKADFKRLISSLITKFSFNWLVSAQRIDLMEYIGKIKNFDNLEGIFFSKKQSLHAKSGMDIFMLPSRVLNQIDFPNLPIGSELWDSAFAFLAKGKST